MERTLIIPAEKLRSAAIGAALNELRTGGNPLPLTDGQATAQAMRLHQAGLSFNSIAAVMSMYHQQHRSPNAWRARLVKAGCPPRRQRGNGLANLQVAA